MTNLLTRNKTKIPLFWVDFNYQKYKESGKENSCDLVLHPVLKDDEYIQESLRSLINYIRDNYDMDEIV